MNLKALGLAQFIAYLTFFKINNGIVPKQILSAIPSPFFCIKQRNYGRACRNTFFFYFKQFSDVNTVRPIIRAGYRFNKMVFISKTHFFIIVLNVLFGQHVSTRYWVIIRSLHKKYRSL